MIDILIKICLACIMLPCAIMTILITAGIIMVVWDDWKKDHDKSGRGDG